MSAERICERDGCSNSLDGRRATARHCGDSCRVAAHRARKAREAQKEDAKAIPRDGLPVTVGEAPVTLGGPSGASSDRAPEASPVWALGPECVNYEGHQARWLRHPIVGRTVCDICHPLPAGLRPTAESVGA